MTKRFLGLIAVAVLAMAPLCAYPWDGVIGMKGETKVVSKSEADAEVYKAANKVNESKRVTEETAQELNETVKAYSDTRAWHPGIGIGGTVDLGGTYGVDLLMSLRYGNVMSLFSIGYEDVAHISDWDNDKIKFGIGCLVEF